MDVQPLPNHLGRHVLGEYFHCESLPDDTELLREQMESAARAIGATIVESVFHRFNPHGLSGVVVIAESHLAIHTWPEHRCASVDLFTCSTEIDPRAGFDYLREVFQASRFNIVVLPRGGLAVRPELITAVTC
ncbi:S-adenosylmethionine decarboxylase proenzyme precursor [Planctomycetes bacterium Pan216]|uniref:S-adenosylmethionine decarboxylase proenzyme n=1 Tax=Kolteria novifilia TaxID=2527975 RepID=A0A518B6Y9_9BACT|nr:S-adenosylmethionine decarboxylase proenzyme precursor [Planctomycetes bacterium Pan216]